MRCLCPRRLQQGEAMSRAEIKAALLAELNRQFDLGVITSSIDADGKPMLSYPIVHPAPRPIIDIEKLADAVLAAAKG